MALTAQAELPNLEAVAERAPSARTDESTARADSKGGSSNSASVLSLAEYQRRRAAMR
jgi:hypothetical protein